MAPNLAEFHAVRKKVEEQLEETWFSSQKQK